MRSRSSTPGRSCVSTFKESIDPSRTMQWKNVGSALPNGESLSEFDFSWLNRP